jgi:hypothetical protein
MTMLQEIRKRLNSPDLRGLTIVDCEQSRGIIQFSNPNNITADVIQQHMPTGTKLVAETFFCFPVEESQLTKKPSESKNTSKEHEDADNDNDDDDQDASTKNRRKNIYLKDWIVGKRWNLSCIVLVAIMLLMLYYVKAIISPISPFHSPSPPPPPPPSSS